MFAQVNNARNVVAKKRDMLPICTPVAWFQQEGVQIKDPQIKSPMRRAERLCFALA